MFFFFFLREVKILSERDHLSAKVGVLVECKVGNRVLVGFTFTGVSALFSGNVVALKSSVLPCNSQGLGLNSFL